MKRLIEFGRKAMFYVRVLSGYEERKIRSYRIQLQQRVQQAEEKKAALRKMPEQLILSEVRRMVDEMKALNQKLEDTEAAIEDYFKPLDRNAEVIMKHQLEAEEKSMKERMKTMQTQALHEIAEAEKLASMKITDLTQHSNEKELSENEKESTKTIPIEAR